ncbi:MAG: fumarylacetoacetate hydrolase family protein [Acetobacteraceae bacterium]|nr:fumarylacetoacetate hydrolase family protein [Acetobacteraceae bacterium]
MRFLRYTANARTALGILEGDTIAEITGDLFATWTRTGRQTPLAAARIEVPLIPPTFYAAGLNYVAHVKEVAESRGETPNFPPQADIGYRAVNALTAHDTDVVIPADAPDQVHYEGELVAIIGKTAKNVSEADALNHVFGYTIGNDVSERTWQRNDRTFFRAKNTDTFKPMGPWIETDLDLAAATTIIRVNGTETIRFPTNDMLYGIATFISRTSRYCTLVPGDVMWMGTDGTSPNLKHNDVVEIDITGLGTLRNRFVRAGA